MATETGALPSEEKARTSEQSVLCLIVTHRGREWLTDCLVSLNTQNYPLLDVLVVDDASTDTKMPPPLKRVAKRHLKRRRWGYLRTPRPLGFGGAINWALARVRTDADLLLFVHDDVVLDQDAVAQMVERIGADETTAIVGPKVMAWDDPQRLEEVGMAADRFGYPYKGLEEGEIDLGQHDLTTEAFYVTSTCMLVRHEVFRSLRGWDARMRAYAEDLDLCWRARLAGHAVRIEPNARVRHAMAMATGRRKTPFTPSRYFIRRNRLRTVFKNASALRLILLIPQFLLLTLAEMLAFIVLRQPREIVALARAIGWNVIRLPQTFSERAKVQKRRKISDRRLRRLTVKQSTRIRAYIGHQRDRLEVAWGRRAEVIAAQAARLRLLQSQTKGGVALLAVVIAGALFLGFRHVWFGEQAAVGELLPYPDSATSLLRAFLSPWRTVGLGQAGPQPPALAMLGAFPLIALGAAGLAQKLLLLGLGIASFVGAYKLVSDLVDRSGRLVAAGIYVLGAVGFAGIREGSLTSLVYGATAPFVLLGLIRLTGWTRPPNWQRNRTIAQVGLGIGVGAAFVPGSLFLYVAVVILLVLTRWAFVTGERVIPGLVASLGSVLLGWALLLPWSAGWFSTGGMMDLLRSDETWSEYAMSFENHGVLSVMTGQTPEGPVLMGLALPLLGLVSVVAARDQRRRLALAMWGVIVLVGIFVGLIATGAIRPLMASPTEAAVLASVAFSALAGLAWGAFRLDLPRRGFGWIHWTTIGSLAAAAFLALAGLGPALLDGDWSAGKGSGRENGRIVAQVRSLLRAEVPDSGVFRALWVGERWSSPTTSAARPVGNSFVTGPRGQVLSDLFERRAGHAERQLQRVIDSIEQGTTDRGGALLGAFNIHLVVLDTDDPRVASWLGQRDLALVRTEPEYLLFEYDQFLARAGVFSALPLYVEGVSADDPGITTAEPEVPLDALSQRSSSNYVDRSVPGSGVVFVAEERDEGWQARFAGEDLHRAEGGWGNAFELAGGSRQGRLEVTYPRSLTRSLGLLLVALAWVVVLGAAFSRRRIDRRGDPR